MMQFKSLIAGCLIAFLAHSPAVADSDWYYGNGNPTGFIRSQTVYCVDDPANRLVLILRLIHLPRETPTDRIMITTAPIGRAVFGSNMVRLQFDHDAWETREIPTEPENLGDTPHNMHYLLDDGLIDRIKNAQLLRVEATFRDYGVRQFEFRVAGLQWPPNVAIEPEPVERVPEATQAFRPTELVEPRQARVTTPPTCHEHR